MKLIEVIEFLVNPDQLKKFYQNNNIELETEALLIYMRNNLDLDSDISFFGIEETDDNLVFEKDGVRYVQLFPVDYAIELIESDLNLKDKGYSNLEIARRLLEYGQKDA